MQRRASASTIRAELAKGTGHHQHGTAVRDRCICSAADQAGDCGGTRLIEGRRFDHQRLRLSRFAFAVARLCHGAGTSLAPRLDIRASAECCKAAAFSTIIRRNSDGAQVPCAIMAPRRAPWNRRTHKTNLLARFAQGPLLPPIETDTLTSRIGSSVPIVFSNGSRGGGSFVSDIDACRVSAFSTCSCGT
jgi:hypothetical protein